MANIGTDHLARGVDLLDAYRSSKGTSRPGGQYGPHVGIRTQYDEASGTLALTIDSNVVAVISVTNAVVDLGSSVKVAESVSPLTVPYINAFLRGTGRRVEKNWRTKVYEVKRSTAVADARYVPALFAGIAPTAVARGEVGDRVGDVKHVAKRVVDRSYPDVVRPESVTALGLTARLAEALTEPEPVVDEDEPVVPVTHEVVAPTATHEALIVTSTIDTDVIPGIEYPAKVRVTRSKVNKAYVALGDIVVRETDAMTLKDAWTLRQTGVPAAVLITGPAGTAKTALAKAFAASQGVPFLKVDGGAIRTADDWAGAMRQDASTKTWSHHWSPFARALKAGTPMVILIDEFNRTESPQAANALMGLIDWTGSLLVPDANAVLRMPPGVLIIATANLGPEFVGVIPIDGAVRQRFPYGVRLDYPPEPVEAALISALTEIDSGLATRLVKLATMQRANRNDAQQYPSGAVISTRVVADIARRIVVCGTKPRDAVQATLAGQFEVGDEKALSVVVDSQFPASVEAEGDESVREGDNGDDSLIVTGKHAFRPSTSGGVSVCFYRVDSLSPVCGQGRYHPVHSV